MGCLASSQARSAGDSRDKTSENNVDCSARQSFGKAGKDNMRLLEEYSVGQTLGEGAFGVVSLCKRRSDGAEFAVKMVDKVETPVDAIRREAEMLQALDHPNIVRVQGVFFEKCFVCIVMDKYSGGDLVEGLQRHLKDRGMINCFHVVHVATQMGSGIQHLHSRNIVHRDVKGDNFLMDRKDIADQRCKIVLTDFGTACHIKPEERLSAGVGTKIFWSPEFYDRNYGYKVDVWAMGIIKYGLVSGRFPFRDENDVRNKEVRIPKRVHISCEEFIKSMLDKSEKSRPTADTIMTHPWITGNAPDSTSAQSSPATRLSEKMNVSPTSFSQTSEMKEADVKEHLHERRQELINRMALENKLKHQGASAGRAAAHTPDEKQIAVLDKQVPGHTNIYEWWEPSKVRAANINELDAVGTSSAQESPVDQSYLTMFSKMLVDFDINPSEFGKGSAKSLSQLAWEVKNGAARMMLDATSHKKLVRVVDIVVLRIRSPDRELLVETGERFPDGRTRNTMRLPGTKKEPYENSKQVVDRVLRDMVGIPRTAVSFDFHRMLRHEQEIESPSYPGVQTVYRKEFIDGYIVASEFSQTSRHGESWSVRDQVKNTKFLTWMSDAEAEKSGVKLNASAVNGVVSSLVRPPIGFNEDALRSKLASMGIDLSRFGKAGTKSLKEFSAELLRGDSVLQQDRAGKYCRIVDTVLLIVEGKNAGTSELLVHAQTADGAGRKTRVDKFPAGKFRPNENQFLTARRILRRQLELDENSIIFSRDVQMVEEQKFIPAYPGLQTLQRKRIIRATVDES